MLKFANDELMSDEMIAMRVGNLLMTSIPTYYISRLSKVAIRPAHGQPTFLPVGLVPGRSQTYRAAKNYTETLFRVASSQSIRNKT